MNIDINKLVLGLVIAFLIAYFGMLGVVVGLKYVLNGKIFLAALLFTLAYFILTIKVRSDGDE